MDWYYAEEGQQKGPVTETEFHSLVQQGIIKGDTLVWREGMESWRPYEQMTGATVAATAPSSADEATAAAATTTGGVVCSECGRAFPQNEVVRYGDRFVCAECKPVFVQKLREGVPTTETWDYGGFWIRFVAKFVDGLIISLPVFIFAFAFGVFSFRAIEDPTSVPQEQITILQILFQLLYYGVAILYNTFFVGKFQATPGKMLCRLRVIVADGTDVSYLRALGRYFAEILSGLVCYIGYIIAAFDEEKRALHDHICNTRVIYKP